MQRLFSTFPGAWPGVGLLLLRCAIAVILIGQGYFYLLSWNQSGWHIRALGITGVATGALLLIGYLTPVASVLAGLLFTINMLTWFKIRSPNPLNVKLQVALGILISAAVLCLGPGAFSIDSRIFGRREIRIPDVSTPPEP